MFMHMPVHMSIHVSIHMSIQQHVHTHVYTAACPYTCLYRHHSSMSIHIHMSAQAAHQHAHAHACTGGTAACPCTAACPYTCLYRWRSSDEDSKSWTGDGSEGRGQEARRLGANAVVGSQPVYTILDGRELYRAGEGLLAVGG